MANSKIKFRYGICQNSHMEETGKPCPLCQSKQIQKVIATKDLVCSECKEKLKEIPRPKTFWEKYGTPIIIAAIILLIGGGFGIYSLLGGSKKPTAIKLAQKELAMKVGETQVITPTVVPEGEKATFIFKPQGKIVKATSGGEITALKKGETTIIIKCEENPEIRAICKIKVEEAENVVEPDPEPQPQPEEPVATEPEETKKEDPKGETKKEEPKKKSGTDKEIKQGTSGTLSLSYGKYIGQISNGYPNGTGRLVYNTSRLINKYDSKKRMAQPGESVQGTFVNGFFTVGKHFDGNGNLIETINVGVVDGVYESK